VNTCRLNILVACNDPTITARLRASLSKLGIECSHSQILSRESAQLAAANHRSPGATLVFFGSQHLSADDVAALSQLCNAAGDCFKVVVVGQSLGAGAILQAVRCGAVDCLSMNGNIESELRHLIDRLQMAPGDRVRHGRLFTVIGAVGGVGATMLATNLAATVARHQQKCALLDLHWRGGDLATFLNSTPRHTLLSLAGKMDQLDRTMFDHSLVKHESGVHLLASPEPYSDYRQIRPELIQKIVQLARGS
jgi:pilus assembly protein CpaE